MAPSNDSVMLMFPFYLELHASVLKAEFFLIGGDLFFGS